MDSLQNNEVHLDTLMPLVCERLNNGASVWFSPKGFSMLPMLRQGTDRVLLFPLPEKLKKYDLPLYRRDNGQYVIHRIIRVGESYTCIGDNQFDLEYGVRTDQMIAVVTAFTRGSKEISVNSLTYQLYCRLWHYSRPLRRLWRRGVGWIRRHS